MEGKELIAKIKRNNQEIKRLINRKLPQNNGVDEEEIVKNEILKNMKCYHEAAARGLRVPERDFIIFLSTSFTCLFCFNKKLLNISLLLNDVDDDDDGCCLGVFAL